MKNVNVTQRTEGMAKSKWWDINWKEANKTVRRLRQRIFRASKEGDLKKVRNLQKLLLKSYHNRCISVRKATQLNTGSHTPGIDGEISKTPQDRYQMVEDLKQFETWKVKPVKRVYIPKANGKQRSLGIPTLRDRIIQNLVKNALEPYWEAKMEATSYGFRPKRSIHDALAKLFVCYRGNKQFQWMVDADIQGCFDNINHDFIMKKVGNFPGRTLIKEWLKAKIVENGTFLVNNQGTPQGSVISPLLSNIALHGMDNLFQELGWKKKDKTRIIVIRYADDFIAACKTLEDAENAQKELEIFLEERGLKFNPEKTNIRHIDDGVDFLGYNIRRYKVTNRKSGRICLIKPSKETVKRIKRELKQVWKGSASKTLAVLIKELNQKIRGYAEHMRAWVSTQTFTKLDRWMFKRTSRWMKRRHPRKSTQWLQKKYWVRHPERPLDKYVFGDRTTGAILLKFAWFNIIRHDLIKGANSPDDPSLKDYYHRREIRRFNKRYVKSYQRIARQQNYKCPVCGQHLIAGEEIQKHHIIPKSKGGKDNYTNLVLVHKPCHQKVHYQTRQSNLLDDFA